MCAERDLQLALFVAGEHLGLYARVAFNRTHPGRMRLKQQSNVDNCWWQLVVMLHGVVVPFVGDGTCICVDVHAYDIYMSTIIRLTYMCICLDMCVCIYGIISSWLIGFNCDVCDTQVTFICLSLTCKTEQTCKSVDI